MPEQIAPKDEWEDDSPFLYRRRDKPVGVRRQRARPVAKVFVVAVLNILVPFVILYGVYRLAVYASYSEGFLLGTRQSISLGGNHVVSRDRLFGALGLIGLGGESRLNLFRLNLAAERQRVEEIPWIKSAVITRIFPNRLIVSIVERTPVAFANVAGHIELVDCDGAFLPMPPEGSFDFPVLDGLASAVDTVQRKELLNRYLQFSAETRGEVAGSGWKVSQADLSHPDDLRILLVQGHQTILVHFGENDFIQRFKTFMSIVPRVLQSYPRINTMDLRYHNEIVVDPDTASGEER